MDWRAKLKALIDSPDEDAPAEIVADEAVEPAEVVEEPATAADDPTETPESVGLGEDPSTEPDSNPAAPDADPTVDPTPTLPDAPGLSSEDRDVANSLAAEIEALRNENETLRTRIAELGGDSALGISEEVVEPIPADEDEGEYDAEADYAAQKAEVARLAGETDEDTDKKDE